MGRSLQGFSRTSVHENLFLLFASLAHSLWLPNLRIDKTPRCAKNPVNDASVSFKSFAVPDGKSSSALLSLPIHSRVLELLTECEARTLCRLSRRSLGRNGKFRSKLNQMFMWTIIEKTAVFYFVDIFIVHSFRDSNGSIYVCLFVA